jgi:tetratricopeptide (TPR) repeat protein
MDAELMRVVQVGILRGDERSAKSAFDALLRAHAPERMPGERPLPNLIRAAVSAGDGESAGKLLAEFERNRGTVPGASLELREAGARGEVLAMRKETLPEAIAEFRKAAGVCSACAEPQLALAFERAGMSDSALARLQHWADGGENLWEAGIYWHWAPIAYFKLGELYEAKGQRDKAVDYYGRFTNLWSEADPEFQPRVQEARQRIKDLTSEPTGQRIGEPPRKP